jgi:hypothetical protein
MDDGTGRNAAEVLLVARAADFDGFTDAIRQIARWFLELIELPRSS